MNELFSQINELKADIDKLKPAEKWNEAYIDKIKIDFTHYTNKIENNTFSYGQTVAFLKDAITPKKLFLKDCLDLKNHFDILDEVLKAYNQDLSEKGILEIHSKLMQNKVQWGHEDDYSPGRYKWDTNYTIRASGLIHQYMDYKKVPEALQYLIEDVNWQLKNVDISDPNKHPLTIATYFHNRFLGEIHPFADGNGRVCRILVNSILLKNDFPPIFIRETAKHTYFECFETSSSRELGTMLTYFGNQLVESLKEKHAFILEHVAQQKDSKRFRSLD
jgi:Fic family protein